MAAAEGPRSSAGRGRGGVTHSWVQGAVHWATPPRERRWGTVAP